MNLARWFFNGLIRHGTNSLCRIDHEELKKVPLTGPLIIAANHINSLEVPLLYAQLQPRRLFGVAKIETWDSKFMGWLFDLWEAIPVRRGEADLQAIHACLDVLAAGDILGFAPEGTRSYHGGLQQGQPGIALLGLRSGAPILPIAHWGGEKFSENIKHARRTDFHIRVGKPFCLDPGGEKVNGAVRQAMADEIMCQLGVLMPEAYQGVYAGRCGTPPKYLKFVE